MFGARILSLRPPPSSSFLSMAHNLFSSSLGVRNGNTSSSTAMQNVKNLRWIGSNTNNTNVHSPLPSMSRKRQTRSSSKEKKRQKQRGRQAYRFVDRTRVQVSGGAGGRGCMSMFHIGRKRKKRPDGGHGGNGGSVIILADPHVHSLRWTRPHILAESGGAGGNQGKHGRNGKNTVLRVPCGVVVRRLLDPDEIYDINTETVRTLKFASSNNTSTAKQDGDHHNDNKVASSYELRKNINGNGSEHRNDNEDTDYNHISYDTSLNSEIDVSYNETDNDGDQLDDAPVTNTTSAWDEKEEKVEIADLDKPGLHVIVSRGGRGGRGNINFASMNGPLPSSEYIAQYVEAKVGESCRIELELKLIADIGLVGFPNSGKSSLLSATSRATPYIAPYPFTTLNPLVGYVEYRDGCRVCIADVPGLIGGASEGRGQGHDFLRHLERTKALLYIVDAAGIDGRNPVTDFEMLLQELSAYSDGDMLNRRCMVVANKIDLLLPDEREDIYFRLQKKANEAGIRMQTNVVGISAGATGEGLSLLTKVIRDIVVADEEEKRNEEKIGLC